MRAGIFTIINLALSRSVLANLDLWLLSSAMTKISYAGYRFPPVIIQQAIWLYVRFSLSFRDCPASAPVPTGNSIRLD